MYRGNCSYLLWCCKIISTVKLGWHRRCWIWLHGKGGHFSRILEVPLIWVGISSIVRWWRISIERYLSWSCNALELYRLLWSTRLLHIGTTVDHWCCCLLLLGTLNPILWGTCPFKGCTFNHIACMHMHVLVNTQPLWHIRCSLLL